jgi:hypothetical protein
LPEKPSDIHVVNIPTIQEQRDNIKANDRRIIVRSGIRVRQTQLLAELRGDLRRGRRVVKREGNWRQQERAKAMKSAATVEIGQEQQNAESSKVSAAEDQVKTGESELKLSEDVIKETIKIEPAQTESGSVEQKQQSSAEEPVQAGEAVKN